MTNPTGWTQEALANLIENLDDPWVQEGLREEQDDLVAALAALEAEDPPTHLKLVRAIRRRNLKRRLARVRELLPLGYPGPYVQPSKFVEEAPSAAQGEEG